MSEEPNQVEPGIHPKLTNPLSEETRKERLYLLGISAIGITIVFTGLIPTEIKTLGITFAEADRTSLLLIVALVVGYFLAAFVSYALSDFIEWRSAERSLSVDIILRDVKEERAKILRDVKEERAKIEKLLNISEGVRRSGNDAEEGDTRETRADVDAGSMRRLAALERVERNLAETAGAPYGHAGDIVFLRFAFDFILPPIVGVFAIAALVIKAFL